MADPFSIAGSAVGVISLGLTVCQGLISYYGPWSAYDTEISYLAKKAEGLKTTLTMLQETVQNFESSDPLVTMEVQRTMLACAKILQVLKSALEKCKNTSPPSDLKEKAQAIRNRMLYPLRRDTVQWLMNSVEGLQSNLNTAMHVLQLAATAYQREQLKVLLSASMSTTASSRSISEKVTHLGTEMAMACIALPTIQENMTRVVSVLEKYEERLTTMVRVFQISQLDPIKHTQESILESSGRSLVWKPAFSYSICDKRQHMETTHPSTETSQVLNTGIVGRSTEVTTFIYDCSCIRRPSARKVWHASHKVSLSWLSMASHHNACPLYKIGERTEILGARWTLCSSLLNASIEATISVTTSVRGLCVNPRMNFINTVPSDAPVFEVVRLRHLRGLCRETEPLLCKSKVSEFFEITLQQLYKLFRDGKASPGDTDPSGYTLLHYACKLVCYLDSYSPDTLSDYRRFLKGLINAGVSPTEMALDGTTPLDLLIRQMTTLSCKEENFLESITDIAMDLIGCGATISESAMWSRTGLHSSLRVFEKIGKRNDGKGFRLSEIAIAVCIKSEAQLCKALDEHRQYINLEDGNGRTPLHLSASWPRGVLLLLKAGGDINKPDRCGHLPLTYACIFKCFPSVRLMVEAGSALQGGNPYGRTILYDAISACNSDILKSIIAALAQRRLRLQILAKHSLPATILEELRLSQDAILDEHAADVQRSLNTMGVPIEDALKVAPLRSSVYHVSSLDHSAADELFNAGFRDVDSVDNRGFTPLMTLQYRLRGGVYYDEMLRFGIWLLSKGADIHRKVPGGSASAGHLIGQNFSLHLFIEVFSLAALSRQEIQRVCHEVLRHPDEPCRAFLFEILTMDNADDCLCACSNHGCYVLTKVLNNFNRWTDISWVGGGRSVITIEMVKTYCLQALAEVLVPQFGKYSPLWAEFIRFATFTRLGLTHTCFRSHRRPEDGLPMDEVEEIRDEERFMLNELDELVLGFEAKYNELQVSLGEFLEGYWSQKMDEVLFRKTKLDEDEIGRAQQLGVVLADCPTSQLKRVE